MSVKQSIASVLLHFTGNADNLKMQNDCQQFFFKRDKKNSSIGYLRIKMTKLRDFNLNSMESTAAEIRT